MPVHQRDKNMKEVLLTIVNKTELLMVDTLEHEFLTSSSDDFMTQCCKFITCGLILGTNVPMIIFIMNQGSKTFLDWLIVFDCFLCLGNLYAVILLLHLYDFWAGFCIQIFSYRFWLFWNFICCGSCLKSSNTQIDANYPAPTVRRVNFRLTTCILTFFKSENFW